MNTVTNNGGYGISISSNSSNGTLSGNVNGGGNDSGYLYNGSSSVTVN
ncbi:uncharacterized protein YgfB (UPF0149 family) [Paenibacillus phyllosphaerae]|uniref:Uncharacterized protein YgfB (UPF0149 family) n=1 Tax=Paenibacillus phyllosphaerae TaxID=274593 RepID=A0A7W5FQC6_9BACL|nr:hypothetical protein [Paenibacillus phyllosphaerae]MBB3113112.1 uncharacterized protein YgfB (UPF0149 family) [Paenibacillus phyllosphaerae]